MANFMQGPNGFIQNLNGYPIRATTNSLSLEDLDISPTQTKQNTEVETAAQKLIPTAADLGSNDSGYGSGVSSGGRSESNNFGFMDKPDVVSYASSVPGVVGMAAAAVNAGFNANNVAAVNEARSMLGLADPSLGQNAKGFMQDNKGFVGDVSIGKNQYGVSLAAMTPDGKTALTPQEARSRAGRMGEDIVEMTPEESKAKSEAFAEANPEAAQGGIMSGISAAISEATASIMDAMFGTPSEATANASTAGFPDAPASPSQGNAPDYSGQDSYSGQGKGYDTPSEGGPGPGMGLGSPGPSGPGLY